MMRILLLLLVAIPGLAIADSGRVLYVAGQVTVERDGRLYRAVKNARVIEGDTIETSETGRLHIRMSDRTLLSLKPDTRFTIQTYRHAEARSAGTATTQGSAPGTDRSVFALFKGGFRAITGLIGQRNKNAFSVNTPVATIGIRGTALYSQVFDQRSYVCTCYGQTELQALAAPQQREQIESLHHDAPRWIAAQGRSGEALISPAPMFNHSDMELMLLEALVGREVPFATPVEPVDGPASGY